MLCEVCFFRLPLTLSEISVLSALVPIILGMIKFSVLDRAFRIIFFVSVVSFVFDIFTSRLASLSINNTLYGHIYVIINQVLLYQFFFMLARNHSSARKQTLITIFLSLLVLPWTFMWGSMTTSLNPLFISGTLIFIISLCLIYYYNLVKYNFNINLWESSSFYIVTGLFLYNFSISALFINWDYLCTVSFDPYSFKLIGQVFLNFLFGYGFYIIPSERSQ